MYTQCPDCLTIYQLDAETIAKGRGRVRCAHCSTIFDCLRTLSEELPDEPDGQLRPHGADNLPPELNRVIQQPTSPQAGLFPIPHLSKNPLITPDFVNSARTQQTFRRWPWIAGNGILLLGFALQLAYAERNWFLNNHVTRSRLDQICRYFQCQLPFRKDLTQMELLSRDVRPHPSVPNALIISATLHNGAPFSQAFPAVEITLSDLDEKIVGKRRFHPGDYVSNSNLREAGMAADATVAVVLEIVEPAKNAVAFEFSFY